MEEIYWYDNHVTSVASLLTPLADGAGEEALWRHEPTGGCSSAVVMPTHHQGEKWWICVLCLQLEENVVEGRVGEGGSDANAM